MLTTLEEKIAYAVAFCTAFAPCDTGEASFAWLTQDYGGKGTTCCYLAHVLAWALGCRSPWVNTSKTGCTYHVGENVSRIWNQGRHPFVPYKPNTTPPRGSIVFISNGPPTTEHVFIFDEEKIEGERKYWYEWDAGQKNLEMEECMRRKKRLRSGDHVGDRKIVGWIPLDNVVCTEDEFEVAKVFGYGGIPNLRDPFTGEVKSV